MAANESSLPAWFDDQRRIFADSYLASDDPYQQSGFAGTPERWKAGRFVILDGVPRDGEFLDIGCANGLLLESLIGWSAGRGITLVPHGIDFVPELVEFARNRFPGHRENFTVANAFDWRPSRRYDYVHTLLEYVPREHQTDYLQRLLDEAVSPGGRLIVSSYGSKSQNQRPLDIDLHLQLLGFHTTGCGNGMEDDGWVATRTAWIDR